MITEEYIDTVRQELTAIRAKLKSEKDSNSENFTRYMEFTKAFIKLNSEVYAITEKISDIYITHNTINRRLAKLENVVDFITEQLKENNK